MNQEKREEILDLLKEGKKSTTEIAGRIKWNHWNTLDILEELGSNLEINKIKKERSTYWELNQEVKNG